MDEARKTRLDCILDNNVLFQMYKISALLNLVKLELLLLYPGCLFVDPEIYI